MQKTQNIIFMGTPLFAVPALEALINAGHNIVAVYTAPPKPAGRGKEVRKSAVHEVAEKHGIPVHTPVSLKTETLPDANFAVVAAYGFLLPKHILEAPKYGCLNIHPSLLPRWRGAAPLQRTLMAGDKRTAVCIMQMNEGLDTGDILAEEVFDIAPGTTLAMLHDKCANIGAELTLKTIQNYSSITPKPQTEEGLTYARKIMPEDEILNWHDSAEKNRNKIFGLNPFPGAYFMQDGKKIKVFEADIENSSGTPGSFLDDKLLVACGDGKALRIKKLQKEGKKPMLAEEFLRGNKL